MRTLLVAMGCLAASIASPASSVTMSWVSIGDAGNAADTASNCYAANCGSVGQQYLIGQQEVTNTQYAEFLNAKGASDPLALYNTNMGGANGGITRSGISGSYTYAVKPGWADRPVNFVSSYDSLRFSNWLHNGQGVGDTESGAYTLLGGTPTPINGLTVTRNPAAIVFLPSENEWYKAAYYDPGTTSFFDYPTGTNTPITCSAPTATPNRANCFNAVGITDVGAYTGSASPYGTYDQGGNMAEWVEQVVGTSRATRGGSWGPDQSSDLAAFTKATQVAFNENATTGFRVASVPEPGSGLLVAAGLLGVAVRRRRSG